MATVELAVAIPAVTVVLALLLAGVDYAITQVRCVDGARTVARMVARGDSAGQARATALRGLPHGAVIAIGGSADEVVARVTAPARAVSWLGLPAVGSEAVAARESDADE